MAQNSSPHTDFSTLQDAPITTSANNKELAKHIKDISQQVLKRNYELYKALENKRIQLISNSPYKISMNSTPNQKVHLSFHQAYAMKTYQHQPSIPPFKPLWKTIYTHPSTTKRHNYVMAQPTIILLRMETNEQHCIACMYI